MTIVSFISFKNKTVLYQWIDHGPWVLFVSRIIEGNKPPVLIDDRRIKTKPFACTNYNRECLFC